MTIYDIDRDFLMDVFEEDILGKLTEREYTMIKLYYLDDKKTTLEEIGNMFHVSRERVRQILAKALKKIRQNTINSEYLEELRELYMEM